MNLSPIIFGLPLHVWLGIVTLFLLILQILIGKQIIKIDFKYHRKIVWIALLIFALLHAFIALSQYF